MSEKISLDSSVSISKNMAILNYNISLYTFKILSATTSCEKFS